MIMAETEKLQLLSLNVRGIRENSKRREIFRWLKRFHNGDNCIIMLQETHSSENIESLWESEWGSHIYYSHGSSQARGVAILLPKHFNFNFKVLWKDTEGRIIALTLLCEGKPFNIVNVYAPTKDKVSEQKQFLNTLELNLDLAESSYIIGGDFNTYLDPLMDKQGGKIEGRTSYADRLASILTEYNFIDVWRMLNPNCKRFTWRQNHPLIQSRLDYFLISGELFYNVTKANIKPSIKCDHSLLQLELDILDEQKRGPGLWKFNCALLRDEIYIDVIRELLVTLKQRYSNIDNDALKWDVIKSEIRQFTIDYSKTQAKIRRQAEADLQIEYTSAANAFEHDNCKANLEQLENIKMQIEAINAIKTAGAHIRSKAQFIEENEKNTSYFLNVEKRNYKMKYIKTLNITDTQITHDPKCILAEERKFYKNLYSDENKTSKKYLKSFFHDKLPTLNDQDKAVCDQPINLSECANALLSLNNGKSPGSDGFPPEFYKMFWKDINNLVYNSLRYGIEHKELSIEQKRGVLKLILKKDKNPCFLKNWRPISLLNSDYKIFAQIFAIRLQKVLPKLISEFQNGYLKNRYIGFNIRTIIDVINYSNKNNKDCLLTFLDFEKAFDQLDWGFINHTLKALNFGSYFIDVIKTMYKNVTSCVMNNGYTSEFFPIKRGIRQGCPLSALLFILSVEILALKIRSSNDIKGITINDTEIKLTQLADDTTLFLNDTSSLQNCLDLLDKFHLCSGLKLNHSKTEVLPIGNKQHLEKLPVKVVQKACSLGIWYFDKVQDIIKDNYNKKILEIEKTISNWKKRKLTLLGKNTVIKSLLVSKMHHLTSNTFTPEWFVIEMQSLIQNFLWDDKPPKIKNSVITNTPEKGGIQFPNIDLIIKTQKLAWVKRILEHKNAAWLQLLYSILPEMDINSILKCTIDPKRLGDELPNFYKQILYAWFELHPQPHSNLEIRREMIWYNKYIKIDDKPFFNADMYRSGIHCLNDLINTEGKIYKYNELINRYNTNIRHFEYIKIIDAIPAEWRRKIQCCSFSTNMVKNKESPHVKINNIDKNILVITSKEMYLKLLKCNETPPTCIAKWNEKLNLTLSSKDWEYIFTLPKYTLSDTKVMELQLKIIHRCYATDSIISKWDNSKSEHCLKCKNKANILHNFFECTEVGSFWNHFKTKAKTANITTPTTLTAPDILFGKYKQAKYDAFNHCCMYAKYYIHRQYIMGNTLNINNFFTYYEYILMVEKQRYTERDQLLIFKQRFGNCTLATK